MDQWLHRAQMPTVLHGLLRAPMATAGVLRAAASLPSIDSAPAIPREKFLAAASNVRRNAPLLARHGLELSGLEPVVLEALQLLAVYPDLLRNAPGYEHTREEHFANIDLSPSNRTPQTPIRGKLITALPAYAGKLPAAFGEDPIDTEHAVAVAMVIHLLGDLTTIGHTATRWLHDIHGTWFLSGGLNEVSVSLAGSGTNLHAVLDGAALRAVRGFIGGAKPHTGLRGLVLSLLGSTDWSEKAATQFWAAEILAESFKIDAPGATRPTLLASEPNVDLNTILTGSVRSAGSPYPDQSEIERSVHTIARFMAFVGQAVTSPIAAHASIDLALANQIAELIVTITAYSGFGIARALKLATGEVSE